MSSFRCHAHVESFSWLQRLALLGTCRDRNAALEAGFGSLYIKHLGRKTSAPLCTLICAAVGSYDKAPVSIIGLDFQ